MNRLPLQLKILFNKTAFRVAIMLLLAGGLSAWWCYSLVVASVPAPLKYALAVPKNVDVFLDSTQVVVHYEYMPILETVRYDQIVAGRYAEYRGVVDHNSKRSFKFYLTVDGRQWFTSTAVFKGFNSNAFYAAASYANGLVTFDPARDWFVIIILGLIAFVGLLAGGITMMIVITELPRYSPA